MNSERHKNLVLRFHQGMGNRGEPAIVDELFAPNYVRHDLRPGQLQRDVPIHGGT
jgi:hypothetical protein